MISKTWFKGYLLVTVVLLIGVLLLTNIFLIYWNSLIIERNKILQEEAESIKVRTIDITRNLHLVDMAVRSYALVHKNRFYITVDSAEVDKEKIFRTLKPQLLKHHFPMREFFDLKDTIDHYYTGVFKMRWYVENDQLENFIKVLYADPGFNVFLKYKRFSDHVYIFENNISRLAKIDYDRAIRNSYWLQIILFLITMPTLGYMAYYANHSLKISERLRKSEEENNQILAQQKEHLELMVHSRTLEIQAQNEEITAQNEKNILHNARLIEQQKEIESQRNALTQQNEQLLSAKKIIEEQSIIIQKKNEDLTVEVEKQTVDLKTTNLELVEQNNRLEQFAYIISHNLRAPLARIVGLASVFDYSTDKEEITDIIRMMADSTVDLDNVIKDLGYILEIQKFNTQVLSMVKLSDVFDKTTRTLKREIAETSTNIILSFDKELAWQTLPQYIESIFYNLISNAIKYRHAERTPVITILAQNEDEFIKVKVSDNGLGIDLEKHGLNLFSLYKRFHFHVEGKGLGLYLVKTQIMALGGKVDIESEINNGTTFTLYFKK